MKEFKEQKVEDKFEADDVQQYEYKDIDCINRIFSKKKHFFINNRRVKNFARVLGFTFIIIGIICYIFHLQVKQIQIPYSIKRNCIINKEEKITNFSKICEIEFQIEETMEGPVYFLYLIEDIYINHKKYIKSFSKKQLKGQAISEAQAYQHCYPIIYNRDLPWNKSWGGFDLDPDAIASPCGLKPMLFFNDTFKLSDQKGNQIPINQKNIVKEDPEYQLQPDSQKFQWIKPTDEHFEVFMLDGALMTKKKLWGVIEKGLTKGKYILTAQNNFRLNTKSIIKGVQLTTSTILGAIHYFLPICFILAGIICLAYSFLIILRLDKMQLLIENSVRTSYRLKKNKD